MNETDIYIGRQPIFDCHGHCIAYELLYRHAKDSTGAVFLDNANATARVIINLIHNIGLSSILGNKIGYINVDDHILMSDVILSLPKTKFVFEILEYTKMSDQIVDKVRHLHELGYRFALDDFSCANENIDYFKLLFPYVDVIKIDLLASSTIELEEMHDKFSPYNVTLLAEKVENLEIFERCKKAGFKFFQGYFFEKPSVISGKMIEPTVANAIDLINTLHSSDDLHTLSHKFSFYPELTFNLLRYVNSAEFNFKHEITSIRQILNLLGPSRLRSWLGLFLYAGSHELMFRDAITDAAKFRAKMMRELVSAHGKPELADEAFLTGSLSLIDTFLQISINDILSHIQLSKSITDALLTREGYLGKILMITEKLETTDKIQNVIENLAPKMNLTPLQLYTIYTNANNYNFEVQE